MTRMSNVIEHGASRPSAASLTSLLPALPGALLVLLGATVMVGWWLQSSFLVRLQPANPPMVFNTALSFFLSGIALSLPFARTERRRLPHLVAGALIATIALLVLAQHVLKTSFGIDWAGLHSWAPDPSRTPGRMSA